MSRFLVFLKSLLLVFWMIFLLSALKTWHDPWRTYINWTGLAILAVHIIEASWFVRSTETSWPSPSLKKCRC
jgi:uncharacterized protein YhhL (DUF1145 family)